MRVDTLFRNENQISHGWFYLWSYDTLLSSGGWLTLSRCRVQYFEGCDDFCHLLTCAIRLESEKLVPFRALTTILNSLPFWFWTLRRFEFDVQKVIPILASTTTERRSSHTLTHATTPRCSWTCLKCAFLSPWCKNGSIVAHHEIYILCLIYVYKLALSQPIACGEYDECISTEHIRRNDIFAKSRGSFQERYNMGEAWVWFLSPMSFECGQCVRQKRVEKDELKRWDLHAVVIVGFVRMRIWCLTIVRGW